MSSQLQYRKGCQRNMSTKRVTKKQKAKGKKKQGQKGQEGSKARPRQPCWWPATPKPQRPAVPKPLCGVRGTSPIAEMCSYPVAGHTETTVAGHTETTHRVIGHFPDSPWTTGGLSEREILAA
jgi:hypothetical protein